MSSLLGLGSFIALFSYFSGQVNYFVFICLLLLLTFSKFLTYQKARDFYLILLMSFLLIGAKACLNYDIVWLTPILVSLFLLWASINQNIRVGQHLTRMIVYAIPLTFLLFFAFPRLESPLTKMGTTKFDMGGSGFSEELKPGEIAKLITDNTTVFRAEFTSKKINNEDLYWRGSLLEYSNGIYWARGALSSEEMSENIYEEMEYSLVMEPQKDRFLFALENTVSMKSSDIEIYGNKDSIYRLSDNSYQRIKINAAVGRKNTVVTDIAPYEQLPLEVSPKVKEVASQIKGSEKSRTRLVSRLASYLKENKFQYTLSPGTLEGDFLEDFLINKKMGFCEHYAGASATLLRLMGVPSRVVVGYQGGKYNENGKYWVITQKDAHAWVEYLNEFNTWVRFDPVFYVQPLRIYQGSNYENTSQSSAWSLVVDAIATTVDNLNYQWTRFLLNYNDSYQKNFIQAYGMILLVILVTLICAAYLFSRWRQKKDLQPKKNYDKIYTGLLQWASKNQFPKPIGMGPIDFLQSLENKFPEHKEKIQDITQYLLKEKYQAIESPIDYKAASQQYQQIIK